MLRDILNNLFLTDLLQTAGDLVRCQEDSVVSQETGGLSDHQETVVEEDELWVQLAVLLPVPGNVSKHTIFIFPGQKV